MEGHVATTKYLLILLFFEYILHQLILLIPFL